MKKALKRDANTTRALAVVRFGHRPPARHKHTHRQDRLQYTAPLASVQCKNRFKAEAVGLAGELPLDSVISRHPTGEQRRRECNETARNLPTDRRRRRRSSLAVQVPLRGSSTTSTNHWLSDVVNVATWRRRNSPQIAPKKPPVDQIKSVAFRKPVDANSNHSVERATAVGRCERRTAI